ncbi:deoxyguanosine kinase, isoform CRA_b [Mus musculus]|nr:deoxyguanosine kinase, isoform CRA_b [Mus musculus]
MAAGRFLLRRLRASFRSPLRNALVDAPHARAMHDGGGPRRLCIEGNIGWHFQTSWKLARNDVPGASTMVLHIPDPFFHEPSEGAAGAHPRETPAGREVCAGL